MHTNLIVIRHGERLDEVSRSMFHKYLDQTASGDNRKSYSRSADAPLTEEGVSQARQMVDSLLVDLRSISCDVDVIFASKLLRATQTAVAVAQTLSVPIILSAGFAMTAKAVEDSKFDGEDFEFLPIDTIRIMYPHIQFIDGDNVNVDVVINRGDQNVTLLKAGQGICSSIHNHE